MLRVLLCFVLLLLPATGWCQNHDVQTSGDSSVTAPGDDGELILDDIEIQGQIEKPGVIVLPKRVNPEIEEVELGRSFDDELKKGVDVAPQAGDALGQVEDVKSIKKAVERKRN
ncbi:hypothetical protein JW948_09920 [bacterium]|nr:hypothetical protein [bacterium]